MNYDNLRLAPPHVVAEIERKALIGFADNNHALISPSGGKRWSKCIGSMIELHEHRRTALDNVPSITGTTAHYLLELCLINRLPPSMIVQGKVKLGNELINEITDWARAVALKPNQSAEVVKEIRVLKLQLLTLSFSHEMRNFLMPIYNKIMAYVAQGYKMYPEMRVDLKKFFHHSQCNGSGDCVLVKGTHLIIVDLKYGVVEEVEPDFNIQLQLYGVGACAYVKDTEGMDIETVEIVICQPRVNDGWWKVWTTNMAELQLFILDMREASLKALIAIGAPESVTSDMYNPSADACQYCHRRRECKPRADQAAKDVTMMFQVSGTDAKTIEGELMPRPETRLPSADILTDAQLADIMSLAPFISTFIKDVEKEAHARVAKGRDIGGRKMVIGRKNRSWKGAEVAVLNKLSAAGIGSDLLFTRKMASVAQSDQWDISPEQRKIVDSLTSVTHGKPVVALAGDSRQSINEIKQSDAIKAFEIKT